MICATWTHSLPSAQVLCVQKPFLCQNTWQWACFGPRLLFHNSFLLEQKEAAHYCSSSCFLMDQESNKHFVQIEKTALLSDEREVRETRRKSFTDYKRETPHKAGLTWMGGRAWEWAERNPCLYSLVHHFYYWNVWNLIWAGMCRGTGRAVSTGRSFWGAFMQWWFCKTDWVDLVAEGTLML